MRPDWLPVPEMLRNRPRVGRFPVPFVTAVVRGRPDFKVHDEVARARAAAERLCQLCGHELGEEIAFVGSRYSVERRIFGEPPAHPACLDFAFQSCPFLAGRNWAEGWQEQARAAGITVLVPPEAPEEMGILITDRFWLVEDDEGATDFKYQAGDPIRDIEWRKRG